MIYLIKENGLVSLNEHFMNIEVLIKKIRKYGDEVILRKVK